MINNIVCLYGRHDLWSIVRYSYQEKFDKVKYIIVYEPFRGKGVFPNLIEEIILERPDDRCLVDQSYEYNRIEKIVQDRIGVGVDEYELRPFHQIRNIGLLVSRNMISTGVFPRDKISFLFKNRVINDSREITVTGKYVFCIPSVIQVPDEMLRHTVFSPEERFEKTLQQCRNIREKIFDCSIIILEQSNISVYHMARLLSYVDTIVLYENNSEIMKYTRTSKNIAEKNVLVDCFERLKWYDHTEYIIKMTSRYKLCPNFDINRVVSPYNLMCRLTSPEFTWSRLWAGDPVFFTFPVRFTRRVAISLKMLTFSDYAPDMEHALYALFTDIILDTVDNRIGGVTSRGGYNRI
jgi:hypothetical protein